MATCSLCRPSPARRARTTRPTTSPKSAADPIEPLHETKDLSMPVHALGPYLGARMDWLPCVGGYPHELRPCGWLKLSCDGRYGGRARVIGLEWRDRRPYRTGDTEPGDGFGRGLAFVIEETWVEFNQPFGDDADHLHQGYRYHRRIRGGELVRFSKGDRVPDRD